MTIGPVQLIVLGFPEPDFHGAIIEELERLRQNDTVVSWTRWQCTRRSEATSRSHT